MQLTINAELLRSALKAVSTIADECFIEITPHGGSIKASDPARAAILEIELNASSLSDTTPGLLRMDIDKLAKVLAVPTGAETVSLTAIGTDYMNIKFGDYTVSLLTREGVLSYKPLTSNPRMPNVTHKAHAILQGIDFQAALKAANVISDHIWLGIDEYGRLIMGAEDDNNAKVTISAPIPAEYTQNLTTSDVWALFSIDYLSEVGRAANPDDPMHLWLANNQPILIEFSCGVCENIQYILAPRIPNEGD